MTEATMNLKTQWGELRAANPHLRIRNAAADLGVSEAELLATQCGENVTRLRPEFQNILKGIGALGKVMALTRNNDVVHERKGVYLNPGLNNPKVGLFVGEDIDLRIFFEPWASAFAVIEGAGGGKPRYSLQFFAIDGEAIHKIYLTDDSDFGAYQQLVKSFRSDDQSQYQAVQPFNNKEEELEDGEIDIESFRKGWVELEDTHDFFSLVKNHRLTRTQALRLAPLGNYAVKVGNTALRQIFTEASKTALSIMVFVGNKGMIQIHTGPVKRLMDHESWFNVLDPDFNLHVCEAAIVESWVVRKPTKDGVVTSLECFNASSELVVQVFGKRKPGVPELEAWRAIVDPIK